MLMDVGLDTGDMLLKDENFTNKVINRYKELRKTYLSNDYIQEYIDDTVNYLGDSINRNFEVWGYTFTKEPLKNMLKPYTEIKFLNRLLAQIDLIYCLIMVQR